MQACAPRHNAHGYKGYMMDATLEVCEMQKDTA